MASNAAAAQMAAAVIDSGTPNVMPCFRATPPKERANSLLGCVKQWNFARPPSRCCSYHAAMDALLDTHAFLEKLICTEEFVPNAASPQCRNCGILVVDTDDFNDETLSCSWCGSTDLMCPPGV